MKTIWYITKRLGWPWSVILAGILGGGFGTHQVFNPGTDYIITLQVMEASETRAKRLRDKKQIERFCGWLHTQRDYAWAVEAKRQLGLCG